MFSDDTDDGGPCDQLDEPTLRYYREHAASYALATRAIPMASCYARFERHLKPGCSILDVGAGSGRDLKYFRQAGYRAHGVDASPEMAAEAMRFSGVPVEVQSVACLAPDRHYDAVWANAVLHHLRPAALEQAMSRLTAVLEANGVVFVSFRIGPAQSRLDDGRLYFGADAASIKQCIGVLPLCLLESWEEGDRRDPARSWLYAIAQRRSTGRAIRTAY